MPVEIAGRDRPLCSLCCTPQSCGVKYEVIWTSRKGRSFVQRSVSKSTGMLSFGPTQRSMSKSLELETGEQHLRRGEYAKLRRVHFIARSRKKCNDILNQTGYYSTLLLWADGPVVWEGQRQKFQGVSCAVTFVSWWSILYWSGSEQIF